MKHLIEALQIFQPAAAVLGTILFYFSLWQKQKKEKKEKRAVESYRIMTYLQEKYSHCVEMEWCNCSHSDKMSGSTQNCGRRCCWEAQKKRLNGTNNDIKTHFLFVRACVLKIFLQKDKDLLYQTHMYN